MPFRQPVFAHALLDIIDIVFHAPVLHNLAVQVIQDVSSPGIAVTRLTHRPRVDDRSGRECNLLTGLWQQWARRLLPVLIVEEDRQVGMSDETIGSVEEFEISRGGGGVEQIFPDRLAWAAMRQGNMIV